MSHKCYSIAFNCKSCSSRGTQSYQFPSLASGYLSYKRRSQMNARTKSSSMEYVDAGACICIISTGKC